MARPRVKAKGRRESATFAAIPHHILNSAEYAALSAQAVKLMLDLLAQYRGANNGDLTAAWRVMEKRGWRSRDTLGRALQELLKAGFIEKTRQGGRNRCSLFAVSWKAIDECKGKLDVPPTRAPSNSWRNQNE